MFTAQRNAAGELAMRSKAEGDSCSSRSSNRVAARRSGTEASSSWMRVAIRSGSPALSRMASTELSIESGQLCHHCNYISRAGRARFHHAGIEAAHSPARRRGIERLHALVVDLEFEHGPVNIQCRTGATRLGDFQYCPSGAQPVADAE